MNYIDILIIILIADNEITGPSRGTNLIAHHQHDVGLVSENVGLASVSPQGDICCMAIVMNTVE